MTQDLKPYELAVFRFLRDREENPIQRRTLAGISDEDVVSVVIDVDGGSQTCYSCDPEDYGSQDYGPSWSIDVRHRKNGVVVSTRITCDNPDLTLGELVAGAAEYLKP